jgi:hypothetical protein
LRYLFFDEVQSHKDWEKHLKPLVDHRPDLRILVSGSAAAALKRQSTESGAGRFTDFLLPPLTFSEYLQLRTEPAAIHEEEPGLYVLDDITRLNQQFVEYVTYGGYPELALSPSVRGNPVPGVNYLELRVASPVNVTGRVVVALWVFFESLMVEGRLWACGRRRRRWATQPPSGALSTVPAGAP